MPPFAKIFDNLKTGIYNKYSQNPAKLLVFTGTLGWALSCCAQVGAIVFNDKLSSKDRQFLIPQEIADGAVNVGLYFGITSAAQKYTEKVIESGKVMFKEMQAPLKRVLDAKNMSLAQALEKNGNKISNILKGTEYAENFVKLKGGASLVTALIGSIISCNILTPLIRNSIGSKWQKKLSSSNEQKPVQVGEKANLTPTQPLAVKLNSINPGQNNLPVYNKFYSSSMKV